MNNIFGSKHNNGKHIRETDLIHDILNKLVVGNYLPFFRKKNSLSKKIESKIILACSLILIIIQKQDGKILKTNLTIIGS